MAYVAARLPGDVHRMFPQHSLGPNHQLLKQVAARALREELRYRLIRYIVRRGADGLKRTLVPLYLADMPITYAGEKSHRITAHFIVQLSYQSM